MVLAFFSFVLAFRPLKTMIPSDVELSFKGKTTNKSQQGNHLLLQTFSICIVSRLHTHIADPCKATNIMIEMSSCSTPLVRFENHHKSFKDM